MNYVLLINNVITIGPRPYNQTIFTREILDQTGVSQSLPATLSGNAVTVTGSVKILPVLSEGSTPSYDLNTQQPSGPFFDIQSNGVYVTYSLADLPLNQSKGILASQVADRRYQREIGGTTVVINGETLPLVSDRESRNIILQAYQLMPDGATTVWKFPPVGFRTITRADLGSMVVALQSHVQNCFNWEASKSDAIAAAASGSALRTLDLVS